MSDIKATLAIVAVLSGIAIPIRAAAAILPEKDAVEVSGLVQESLKVDDLDVSFVSEGKFAIAFWKAANGHGAGEALARKNGGSWAIVRQTSGSLKSVKTLESLGVPEAQAKALVSDLTTVGR
jgi:hypothetical protein